MTVTSTREIAYGDLGNDRAKQTQLRLVEVRAVQRALRALNDKGTFEGRLPRASFEQSVILGHSFGGATAVAACSFDCASGDDGHGGGERFGFERLVVLDPWLSPLNQQQKSVGALPALVVNTGSMMYEQSVRDICTMLCAGIQAAEQRRTTVTTAAGRSNLFVEINRTRHQDQSDLNFLILWINQILCYAGSMDPHRAWELNSDLVVGFLGAGAQTCGANGMSIDAVEEVEVQGESDVFTDYQFVQLVQRLPRGLQSRWWRRAFSTAHDGSSMQTLRTILRRGGARVGSAAGSAIDSTNGYASLDMVLLIQDTSGATFGGVIPAFDTTKMCSSSSTGGGSESFVFCFCCNVARDGTTADGKETNAPTEEISVWESTGTNGYFAELCNDADCNLMFTIGGGEGGFAVCLDEDFAKCRSNESETFGNPILCGRGGVEGAFEPAVVEVWELARGLPPRQQSGNCGGSIRVVKASAANADGVLPPLLLSRVHAAAVRQFRTTLSSDNVFDSNAQRRDTSPALTTTPCRGTSWGEDIKKHNWIAISDQLGLSSDRLR
jgi:hypothetical protein